MRFELDQYNRNITDDELIADLQRVAAELKKQSVTMREYNEAGKFYSTTIMERFGGWFAALEKAGLEKTRRPKRISDEDLFRNLEEVWTRLGRQPRYDAFKTDGSIYSVGPYVERFGSWRNALKSFISYINDEDATASDETSVISKAELNPKLKASKTTSGNKQSRPDDAIESLKVEPTRKHKTSRTINWRLRFIVMRRDNFKCKICGRAPATDPTIVLHVDHIQAWENWGETVLENLQTLCSKCNIGKSDLEFTNLETTEAQNV